MESLSLNGLESENQALVLESEGIAENSPIGTQWNVSQAA